jgi:CYTH domain-containing protein
MPIGTSTQRKTRIRIGNEMAKLDVHVKEMNITRTQGRVKVKVKQSHYRP